MDNNKNIYILNGDEIPFKHSEFSADNKKPKILFLGNRVTKESINAGYYYFGLKKYQNVFWYIISFCFDDKDFETFDTKKVVEALKRHNIVVCDLIYSCKYTGSSDNETIKGTEIANMKDLTNIIRQADIVFLNGGHNAKAKTGTLDYFHKFLESFIDRKSVKNKNKVGETGVLVFDDGKKTYYCSLVSSSGEARNISTISAYGGRKYSSKEEAWKKEIEKTIKDNLL